MPKCLAFCLFQLLVVVARQNILELLDLNILTSCFAVYFWAVLIAHL